MMAPRMSSPSEPVELYYWPGLPGRGELVRIVLEEAGCPYVDVARLSEAEGGGVKRLLEVIQGALGGPAPFAPPILRFGSLVLSQTANICDFLGQRFDLAGDDEADKRWAFSMTLTILDVVNEAHDTHHPVSTALYFEQQREEARRASASFLRERMPKYLRYLERALERNAAGAGRCLVGKRLSYADLCAFQLLEGLAYSFPRGFVAFKPEIPLLASLREAIRARPRIRAYLESDRRLAFNETGIFRHYPELDEAP
jgi:glutathione S-transferase